jgi:hypothetical protein
MKDAVLFSLACSIVSSTSLYSQTARSGTGDLEAVNVSVSREGFLGQDVVKVVKNPAVKAVDEPTFAKIRGSDFTNGTIEVKVLSRLLANASESARGFIGVAFRIKDDNSAFEAIYIRPTNGRADDQVRRNHSIQYFSYPDHKFNRLRVEAPEKYESYADMGLNEWITMRIVVRDQQARLFLGDNVHPSLVVTDLKRGPNSSGSIGLWVDVGTEGYFTDLKILRY